MLTQLFNWVKAECGTEIYSRTIIKYTSELNFSALCRDILKAATDSEILRQTTILGLLNTSKHFRIVRLLLLSTTIVGFHFPVIRSYVLETLFLLNLNIY